MYKRKILRDSFGINTYIHNKDETKLPFINNTGILELEKIIFE